MATPVEEAARWFRQAEADLRTAHELFKLADYSACSFHSQQAAEKALKALLYSRSVKAFLHSLTKLLGYVSDEGFSEPDDDVREAAANLDEHYTSSRYPDAFESQIPSERYTAEVAEEALKWAELILKYSGDNLHL